MNFVTCELYANQKDMESNGLTLFATLSYDILQGIFKTVIEMSFFQFCAWYLGDFSLQCVSVY